MITTNCDIDLELVPTGALIDEILERCDCGIVGLMYIDSDLEAHSTYRRCGSAEGCTGLLQGFPIIESDDDGVEVGA